MFLNSLIFTNAPQDAGSKFLQACPNLEEAEFTEKQSTASIVRLMTPTIYYHEEAQ